MADRHPVGVDCGNRAIGATGYRRRLAIREFGRCGRPRRNGRARRLGASGRAGRLGASARARPLGAGARGRRLASKLGSTRRPYGAAILGSTRRPDASALRSTRRPDTSALGSTRRPDASASALRSAGGPDAASSSLGLRRPGGLADGDAGAKGGEHRCGKNGEPLGSHMAHPSLPAHARAARLGAATLLRYGSTCIVALTSLGAGSLGDEGARLASSGLPPSSKNRPEWRCPRKARMADRVRRGSEPAGG
jgi:hypothetical protein